MHLFAEEFKESWCLQRFTGGSLNNQVPSAGNPLTVGYAMRANFDDFTMSLELVAEENL